MSCENVTPGIVIDIVPMYEIGARGKEPVAIVEHDWEGAKAKATVNVQEGQEINVGDLVEIHRIQQKPNLTVLTLELAQPAE